MSDVVDVSPDAVPGPSFRAAMDCLEPEGSYIASYAVGGAQPGINVIETHRCGCAIFGGYDASSAVLLPAQGDYIGLVQALVAESAADRRFMSDARRAVIPETERRYPNWLPVAGVPDQLGIDADAVARERGLDAAPPQARP